MSRETSVAFKAAEVPSAAGLAQFFPDAVPVRIPVEVRLVDAPSEAVERTVIEFGTPREVLFCSGLPLEFAARLELASSDRTLQVEASVVAMQYKDGPKVAVAARFLGDLANWIVKAG